MLGDAIRVFAAAVAAVRESRPTPVLESYRLYLQIIRADGGAALRRRLSELGVIDSPFLRGSGREMSIAEYTALLERWDDFRSRMLAFWREHHLLLCPVNAHAAIEHGALDHEGGLQAYSYTMTDNLTGWPVAVVRCGTSADGLPIGLPLVAPPWREEWCLAGAQLLEHALGGWQPSAI